MVSVTNDDITKDVTKLINLEDEAEWHKGGLFKVTDSLGVNTGTHFHTYTLPTHCPIPST